MREIQYIYAYTYKHYFYNTYIEECKFLYISIYIFTYLYKYL